MLISKWFTQYIFYYYYKCAVFYSYIIIIKPESGRRDNPEPDQPGGWTDPDLSKDRPVQ